MSQQTSPPGRNWRLTFAVWGILVVVLLIFIFTNLKTVEIQLLFAETETRLAWAIIGAAVVGFVIGLLLPRLRRRG